MGDGGSYFIGFVLAASSAIGLMQEPSFSLTLLPFLILAVPLADMTRVIAVRLFNGKSPFIGDQNHLHHRFLKAGLSVKTVVSLMYNLIWLTGSWAIVLAGVPAGWIAIVIALFSCIATSQSLWHPFLAKREKTLALTSSTYTA
jgi:UDP-N-acetylmuramyl pentapeptide phosphotransferase/UDP-N-acetylglucosamine-1-phosphate transferase